MMRVFAAATFGVVLASCQQTVGEPGRPIGALLPFTGDLAASGANLERGLLMALDNLNAAGGVAGQPLRLVSRDTHSDLQRGLAAGRDLIDQEGAFAILGPEDPALAEAMVPLLEEKRVLQISGGASSVAQTDPATFWYRIVPAAQRLGSTLAQRIAADGVARVAILFVDDPYGHSFADVAEAALAEKVVAKISFPLELTDASSTVEGALSAKPDAILLVAYPKNGAAILEEWSSHGGVAQWYWGPSLRSADFVQNVAPGLIEGTIGVSSVLAADAAEFATTFKQKWAGDEPLVNAYSYYDAMVVTALAIEAAAADGNGNPDRTSIAAYVQKVSSPPGTVVSWKDAAKALELVRNKEEINYRGASGSVDFDAQGDVAPALVQFWTVREGKISSL